MIIELDAHCRRRAKSSSKAKKAPVGPPKTTPPRIVSLMQKAIEFQRLLEDGEVPSRAELARLEGVTRARVTQIMKLLALAPDIQRAILELPAGTQERLVTERRLRPLADMTSIEQRAVFRALIRGRLPPPKVAV